jgi:Zn-dependent protease with chaperone function
VQLYYFLALILSLSFGSVPETGITSEAALDRLRHAALFTALAVLAWWTLCYLSVRLVGGLIDRGEVSREVGMDWFDRHLECFRWLSLGLILLCLGGFGLGRDLEVLPVVGRSLALQSAVLLLPALLMMLGVWAAEYGFGVRVGLTRFGVGDASRWLWNSMRCTVGWLLVPVLAVLTVLDLFSVVSIAFAIPAWLFWPVLLVAVVCGLPWAVRNVFPTRPPDDQIGGWIRALTDSAGLRGCRIVVWQTGGRTHNAMIAGLGGRFRVLMVSDRLLRELLPEQLAMVILHEVAHARRRHALLRILALVPVWLLGGGLQRVLNGVDRPEWMAAWAASIAAAASLAGTVLVLRWASHATEFDADAVACDLAVHVSSQIVGVPGTSADAGRALAGALRRVTDGCPSARRSSWLHPGIDQRADRLTAC